MSALSPFLRGKQHWFRGEAGPAIACLEQILGDGALYVSDDVIAARAELPFEGFVTSLLADDHHLLLPFGAAVSQLWAAFPGRYALDALLQRERLEEADVEWLYGAAREGLLSTDPADHDRVGKVVLPPELPAPVDRARLESELARGAWADFIATHGDLVANLFLDAVFYRARVMDAAMALDRLDRIAELQPELLDVVADALAGWDAEEAVRVGMRRASAPPECLNRLVDALRSRDFDALPPACLPSPDE